MKRIVYLGLTLVLVLALGASASAATSRVAFEGASGGPQVRPHQLALTGDGTLVVGTVSWLTWGGRQATGSGTAEYHGCTPSCAQAKVHHAFVAITLSNVQVCKGKRYYTHVKLAAHYGLLDKRFLRIGWNPCKTP
jgi:hypothetical protein